MSTFVRAGKDLGGPKIPEPQPPHVTARIVSSEPLTPRSILRLWWPLAASWLLMGAELPLFSAVVARLPDAERNLAAWGSLVFPIALTIEAPIIMLLSASTALCHDRASYERVRSFMLRAGAALTGLHALVAFSPLFDWLATTLIDAPADVIEPGRLGFQLMLPWTWSIAYRRFQQGILIRHGNSRVITAGTLVRIAANLAALAAGWWIGDLPGIAVGACAVSAGVMSEAAFIGVRVQRVLRERVWTAPAAAPLSWAAFASFYLPLALTPLVTLLGQPIGSAAMSRMSAPLDSLATWPAYHGAVFLARALGLAFNEVVIALAAHSGAIPQLRRFTWQLSLVATSLLTLVAFTPLSRAWFEGWSDLDPRLATLGASAMVFALALPALNVLQSYYGGILVRERKTRAVTESVALSLGVTTAGLFAAIHYSELQGLQASAAMMTLGNLAQTVWLAVRARPRIRALEARDAAESSAPRC